MTKIEKAALELAEFLKQNCAPPEAYETGREAEWPVDITADDEEHSTELARLLTNMEKSLVEAGYMENPKSA